MKHGTLSKIAKSVNLSRGYICNIINRNKNCPPRLAVILEKHTGVSRVLWVWGTRKELREALDRAFSEDEPRKRRWRTEK